MGRDGGSAEFVAEVLPGVEPFAQAELAAAGATVQHVGSGEIAFASASWEPLYRLRRCVAVYRLSTFDVPRPKALLGDRDFRRLIASLDEVRAHSSEPFASFRFGAAGSDSSVFRRLADAIADATDLLYDAEAGELLVRVRPASDGGSGWHVLQRLTPRPLSARAWRVCNMAGGLNATLAAALHDLALAGVDPGRADLRYLNAMCGSGTLLVEWRLAGARGAAVGCDVAPEAVVCTHENAGAAGIAGVVEVRHEDATHLDAADESFDLVTSDLPWGDAVGSHGGNRTLYPAFLDEASRLLAPDGILTVLTHEIQLFEELLRDRPAWRVDRVVRVFHGGHWPRMYRLVRNGPDAGGS